MIKTAAVVKVRGMAAYKNANFPTHLRVKVLLKHRTARMFIPPSPRSTQKAPADLHLRTLCVLQPVYEP